MAKNKIPEAECEFYSIKYKMTRIGQYVDLCKELGFSFETGITIDGVVTLNIQKTMNVDYPVEISSEEDDWTFDNLDEWFASKRDEKVAKEIRKKLAENTWNAMGRLQQEAIKEFISFLYVKKDY